jgi:hypothetical protein
VFGRGHHSGFVGVHRFVGDRVALVPDQRLFTFTR